MDYKFYPEVITDEQMRREIREIFSKIFPNQSLNELVDEFIAGNAKFSNQGKVERAGKLKNDYNLLRRIIDGYKPQGTLNIPYKFDLELAPNLQKEFDSLVKEAKKKFPWIYFATSAQISMLLDRKNGRRPVQSIKAQHTASAMLKLVQHVPEDSLNSISEEFVAHNSNLTSAELSTKLDSLVNLISALRRKSKTDSIKNQIGQYRQMPGIHKYLLRLIEP